MHFLYSLQSDWFQIFWYWFTSLNSKENHDFLFWKKISLQIELSRGFAQFKFYYKFYILHIIYIYTHIICGCSLLLRTFYKRTSFTIYNRLSSFDIKFKRTYRSFWYKDIFAINFMYELYKTPLATLILATKTIMKISLVTLLWIFLI